MKTAGEVLYEARKKQEKTLEEVNEETKISVDQLQKIENDNFDCLPPATFTKGLIRNYAIYLGLEPEKILALWRRDCGLQDKRSQVIPGSSVTLEKNKFFSSGSSWILVLMALVPVVIFFFFQTKSYIFPPALSITEPSDNVVLTQEKIEIKGKTIPDATVWVNGQLAELSFDGSFSSVIKLLPGENIIEVKAVNRRGKETRTTRKITVDKKD